MAVFKKPQPPARVAVPQTTSNPTVSRPPAPPARPPARPPMRPPMAPPPWGQTQQSVAARPQPPIPRTAATAVAELPKDEETEVRQPFEAAPEGRPRFREGQDEAEGQVTMLALHNMSLTEKHSLWKKMNQRYDSTSFVPLLRRSDMPKRIAKEYPPEGRPAIPGAMWCCYCGDWTIYESFVYVGSDRCIGCSISTKDYYNRSANKLWKVDL